MTSDGLGADNAAVVRARTRWSSAAALLGIATAVGHAFSYAFSLVLSRVLGPADFGALGALLGLAIVATVPATALQTQLARVTATGINRAGVGEGYRLSWLIGLVLAAGLTLFSLPLGWALRLEGPLSVLLLAAGLLPASVIAARQGVLLGRASFALLALTTVLIPALRLGAVVIGTAITDLTLEASLGLQAAATWVGLFIVIVLVQRSIGSADDGQAGSPGPRLRGVVQAGSSLLGLFVLANVDVLLARVFLSDTQSGIYAVGALGAKVVFWGSQFVALLVFPKVAQRQGGVRLVATAGLMITAVGAIGALAAIPLAGPVLEVLVGPAYAEAATVAPWFVLLGTTLALVQLMTYAAVARDRHHFSLLLWATVIGQSIVIALIAHSSVQQIVLVCIIGTSILVVLSAALVQRGRS
ncbi:MAG: hypothetical protein Q4G67_00030 [Actinomycetia bacterium]|nr:hypothetical protein [Actinomycetes bacterium]